MATLTLRILTNAGDTTKGSTLSSTEMDQNLISLNNEIKTLAPISKPTFMSSSTNDFSYVNVKPSGIGGGSEYLSFAANDIINSSWLGFGIDSTISYIKSSKNGTGSYLPIAIELGGSEKIRIGTTGNISINSTATNSKLTVDASANASTTFYSGHFELSGSTFGASRFLLSQGSTYGLAFAQTGTSALTGRTDIQWVDVATGVTQNTPIAISGSGAVGLGTTNSGNSTLQVWQGTKNYGLEVMAATGGTNSGIASIRIINSGNTVERIGIYGESDTLSTFTYPSVIRFVQGATERVRIDASGYVGVGAVPSTKIHVYGANTASPDFANGDGVGATVYLQDTGGAGFNGGQLLFGALQGSFAGIKGELNNGTGPAGSLLFQTRGTSGNIIARMRIDTSGNVVPTSTNAYDLGTTALRWRNIYTQDLHLSNGIGDYTVVEGLENLYLVNNKTSKSFKFALIEVDPSEVPEKSKVSDGT